MRALMILPLLLSFAAPANANEMEIAMTKRCKARFPHEHSMQLFCLRQQVEHAREFIDLLKGEAASGDLKAILAVCFSKWDGSAVDADWPMVTFCYRREREAWQAMSKFRDN